MKRLLVLGASGGCGRWLAQFAAERGSAVTAIVRPASEFNAPAGVRVLRAEALDVDVLEQAVRGADVVISCLGLRRAGVSPSAPLLSPPDLTARVTELVVRAMRRNSVRRIIALSAGGVGDSLRQLSRPVRWLVGRGNIAAAYRDLANMEQSLAASGLDWLAVRPVTLTNGSPTGRGGPVERYGITSTIRRADVASWMIRAAEGPAPFAATTVLLGTRRRQRETR